MSRTLIRPTGFVDAPFGHDGKVARLAGGLAPLFVDYSAGEGVRWLLHALPGKRPEADPHESETGWAFPDGGYLLFGSHFGSEFQPLAAAAEYPDPVFGHPVELIVADKPSYADSGVHWRRGEAQAIARSAVRKAKYTRP